MRSFLRSWLILSLICFTLSAAAAPAIAKKPSEYDLIVKHLKDRYKAKKIKIPFMWLARFAVSMVRPAGVKSFSITLFEDLKFSRGTIDFEMQTAMKRSYGEGWSPIFHIRSAKGQQAYMYMRESGKNIKVALVTIDKKDAAILRATFSPERLSSFINDPKLFGISLDDKRDAKSSDLSKAKTAQ